MAFTKVGILVAGAFCTLAAPAAATEIVVDPDVSASLQRLVAMDLRVASVAYRLQTAGTGHCSKHVGLPGLIIQDSTQYRSDLRPAMAALFNLQDLPAVTGVVANGAAARAGIQPGDVLVLVNGASVADVLPGGNAKRSAGHRYSAIVDMLDHAFADGRVTFVIRRAGALQSFTFAGAPACASDVQLDLSRKENAYSDGTMITVSQGMADFVLNDDELSFVIGHELAHNILGHRETLDATRTSRRGAFAGLGANGARIRETEREADYLGLYLVAWAGFDYHAAAALWRRMATQAAYGLRIGHTHPNDEMRVRELERAAVELDLKRGEAARLDPDFAAFARKRR